MYLTLHTEPLTKYMFDNPGPKTAIAAAGGGLLLVVIITVLIIVLRKRSRAR